mmetsp:Transcript_108958/g.213495  ORF Transcript_108958/g.213495 Transcript_108958/m.213495 type:complete len:84 (+) Transcript_108958:85-336(+)
MVTKERGKRFFLMDYYLSGRGRKMPHFECGNKGHMKIVTAITPKSALWNPIVWKQATKPHHLSHDNVILCERDITPKIFVNSQ